MFKKGHKPSDIKRGAAKPEIFLLLFLGLRPQDIIRLGFGQAITYRYSMEYPKLRERLRLALVNDKKSLKG